MADGDLMGQLLASMEGKKLRLSRGERVEGQVMLVTDSEVVVDMGGKSEGVISKKEFPVAQQSSLKVGDSITAYVVNAESDSGQVVLALQRQTSSKVSTHFPKTWEKFFQAKKSGRKLQAQATQLNKGGLVVEVMGARGFLPSSQIGGADSLENLVGQELEVKVLEVDPQNNRLIFTQREQVSQEAAEAAFASLAASLKPDDVVKGKVTRVANMGVFVGLDGGVEGLIHSSKLESGAAYSVGQKVSCLVDSIDPQKRRISLAPFITTTKGLIYK